MAKLNILVFIVLYIIGNIIIFKGPFQNLINGTGTTKYQKSDEIVEGKIRFDQEYPTCKKILYKLLIFWNGLKVPEWYQIGPK